jgi:ribonuclease HIII
MAIRILGIDESGKGDFFGPLVIAGVVAAADQEKRLTDLNVRDSKKISNGKVRELSRRIKKDFVHSTVVIGPEKYNQLYEKIRNLNRLLAWGHSRVIENIAAEHEIDIAISDKFGREELIEKALMKNGRKIALQQIVRGESRLQVAAASILARAQFLEYLERMEKEFGFVFPRGAGAPVDKAAHDLLINRGRDILDRVAKIHFRNYKKLSDQ